jgi:hypothetical protein
MRTLKLTSGPEQQTLEIEGELVVGRENADVVVPDTEMSRRHAVLRAVERGVEVEDLGSMNGTFVNGERIAAPVTLTSNGNVRMGTTEMEIEVMLPQVTVASQIPTPDVTVTRETPDVTVARNVPEVTAVRQTPPQTPPGPPPAAGPPAGGPPAGGPPGGGPPGGGPPGGGPPGGPPKIPLPARLVLKYPPARTLLPKMRGPIPLRLLLTFLITVLLPLAVIVVLVLVVL